MKTMTFDEAAPLTALKTSETPGRAMRWTGRILAGLPILFIAMDGAMKFTPIPEVVEGTAQLGFQPSALPLMGTIELLGVLLVCLRRTRVFGAVLLSAYLGGAVAIHVQQGHPLFTHTLFPIYVAALLWAGLCLLDRRVQAISPFAK